MRDEKIQQRERWTLWFDKHGTPVGIKGGVMIGAPEDYERTLDVVPASERDRYREALMRQWAEAHYWICRCEDPDAAGCAWPVPVQHSMRDLREAIIGCQGETAKP